MRLEEEIDKSNEYFRLENIAVIHKKPTPIQIVDVDYPKRQKRSLKKLILESLQQQIIMVFIMDTILILKLRKRKIKQVSL